VLRGLLSLSNHHQEWQAGLQEEGADLHHLLGGGADFGADGRADRRADDVQRRPSLPLCPHRRRRMQGRGYHRLRVVLLGQERRQGEVQAVLHKAGREQMQGGYPRLRANGGADARPDARPDGGSHGRADGGADARPALSATALSATALSAASLSSATLAAATHALSTAAVALSSTAITFTSATVTIATAALAFPAATVAASPAAASVAGALPAASAAPDGLLAPRQPRPRAWLPRRHAGRQ
jgi:hypothetical protein